MTEAEFGPEGLAPYATDWRKSRGRLFPEGASATRTPFQRDRDRIIHSTAFRRLGNKTQVFIAPEEDHVRTRLTHSMEVAQIADSLARVLNVDLDLTAAVALSHDLGHTPYGHAGEDVLADLMAPYGGFDHNDQALRILTKIESRHPDFNGLNLSWETLEGIVKHNGPVMEQPLPATLAEFNDVFDLEIDSHAGLEAQVAAIADDIAYNHHDMDDGLRAGIFSIADVCDSVPHVAEAFTEVRRDYPDADTSLTAAEAVRRLIGHMVADTVAETQRRLAVLKPNRVEDIRGAGAPMVGFSDRMAEDEAALKRFLFSTMYRAPSVDRDRLEGARIVADLFRLFMAYPNNMPAEWRREALSPGVDTDALARIAADYIAGMTDRYAKRQHRFLFAEKTGRDL